jgi:precorrin-2/cobalt-factor-2 C20-methyltransferase
LVAAGRMERAVLIEYAAMPEERVMPFADAPEKLPYFSIVVIHGQGRRP